MSGEPSIGDYGVIGDCQSAALIGRDGAIDWCCLPDFDSPAIFCRLLDREKGGYWEIQPDGPFTTSRRYLDQSNVLETVFHCQTAKARLIDLMPIREDGTGRPFRILRLIEGVEGRLRLRVKFKPSFDFAGGTTRLSVESQTVIAACGSESVALCSSVSFKIRGDLAEAWCNISASQRMWFAFSDHSAGAKYHSRRICTGTRSNPRALEKLVGESFIRRAAPGPRPAKCSGAKASHLRTHWRDHRRADHFSAGAPGGDLNWDYRYT